MSLTWHIVRKDLRRMRVPLALWAVVLIAKQELGVHLLQGDARDYNHFDLVQMGVMVLAWVEVFVNTILVALLVQEDAVVGTRMFWATRPIAGGRLLAAKLLGAGLMFGALPIVIALRWWLACDYGAVEMARAAMVTLDAQALVVLGALLLATLTENVNRFLVAVLGSWVVLMAWIFLLVRLNGGLANDWAGLGGTRALLLGTVLVAGFVAAIGVQFRTRRLGRSVALAAGATMVATVILFHGPRSWDRPLTRSAGKSPAAAGITLAVARAHAASSPWRDRQWVSVHYVVRGLPEGYGVAGETWNTLRASDGHLAKGRALLNPIGAELGEWLAAELPREKFQGPIHRSSMVVASGQVLSEADPDEAGRSVVGIATSQAQVDRLRREPGTFTGEARLVLTHPEKVLELPIVAGASGGRDGYRLRVAAIEWRNDALTASVVESQPLLSSFEARKRPGLSTLFGMGDDEEDEMSYALVNRARGEMIKVQPTGVTSVVVGTQVVRWFNLTLQPRETVEGATLSLVRHRAERFWRTTHVEKLPLTLAKNPQ